MGVRLYVMSKDTAVIACHGPDATIGFEKRHNTFVKVTWFRIPRKFRSRE